MSFDNNPAHIFKERILAIRRRLYFVRGITDKDKQVDLIDEELAETISSSLYKLAWKAWIKQLISDPFEQKLDREQIDFFNGDIFWSLKRIVVRWCVEYKDKHGTDRSELCETQQEAQALERRLRKDGCSEISVAQKDVKKSENIHNDDLETPDVDQISGRKQQHIVAAINENERWQRHVAVIRPIMVAHGFKWGQAVKWQAEHGGLPDLD